MPTKAKYSNFGSTVSQSLTVRATSQTSLAKGMGTSASYLNQTMTGRKTPTAQWADLVADVLNAPEHERQRIHAAAALDNGFKLDLTKK